MIRPSAETNDPEPPLLKRTADDRRCSAQPGGGSKPYRALSAQRQVVEDPHPLVGAGRHGDAHEQDPGKDCFVSMCITINECS